MLSGVRQVSFLCLRRLALLGCDLWSCACKRLSEAFAKNFFFNDNEASSGSCECSTCRQPSSPGGGGLRLNVLPNAVSLEEFLRAPLLLPPVPAFSTFCRAFSILPVPDPRPPALLRRVYKAFTAGSSPPPTASASGDALLTRAMDEDALRRARENVLSRASQKYRQACSAVVPLSAFLPSASELRLKPRGEGEGDASSPQPQGLSFLDAEESGEAAACLKETEPPGDSLTLGRVAARTQPVSFVRVLIPPLYLSLFCSALLRLEVLLRRLRHLQPPAATLPLPALSSHGDSEFYSQQRQKEGEAAGAAPAGTRRFSPQPNLVLELLRRAASPLPPCETEADRLRGETLALDDLADFLELLTVASEYRERLLKVQETQRRRAAQRGGRPKQQTAAAPEDPESPSLRASSPSFDGKAHFTASSLADPTCPASESCFFSSLDNAELLTVPSGEQRSQQRLALKTEEEAEEDAGFSLCRSRLSLFTICAESKLFARNAELGGWLLLLLVGSLLFLPLGCGVCLARGERELRKG